MKTKRSNLRTTIYLRGWLALAFCCAGVTGIGMLLSFAGPQADAKDAERDRIAYQIENVVQERTWDGSDLLQATYPVLYVDRFSSFYKERFVVDVSQINRNCAGWKARVTFAVGWHRVKAIPPPMPRSLMYMLGSQVTRHEAGQARKLILILCATVWSVIFVLLPFAGPWRRKLALISIGITILALVTWAADANRAEVFSLPAADWIALTCLAGLGVGIVVAALPVRPHILQLDRCSACGYDLTGNESGTCPECGTLTPLEARHRRDVELSPLAEAIEKTLVEPSAEEAEVAGEADEDFTAPDGSNASPPLCVVADAN